jgi:hypothetical protein
MKKVTLALLGAMCMSAPAFAVDSMNDEAADVQADQGAIQKDNAAIRHHKAQLARHRAEKQNAKANSAYGTQAGKSMAIAGDKTMIHEKRAERNVDQRIMNKDRNDVREANGSDRDYNDRNYSDRSYNDRTYNDRNYSDRSSYRDRDMNNMSPAAGSFLGMNAQMSYPTAPEQPRKIYNYYSGNYDMRNDDMRYRSRMGNNDRSSY